MPLGDIKPQISGVVSKMLGQRTYKAQPEDEGMAEMMPATFSRSEFGMPHFDPASARMSPIPVQHLMTPTMRAQEPAPGPGDIGGGPTDPGTPAMPPAPTGPGYTPGTGGVPVTAPRAGMH